MNAILFVSNGNIDVTSDFISLVPQEHTVPKNEIWYTSYDERIIPPDTETFGANIISNTYENGLGIIEFDGPIEYVGAYAFYGKSRLTSIHIPSGVTYIGGYAFEYCNRLTYITLPDSIMFIEGGAFWDCENLKKITLPKNLKTIEYHAFGYCESLTNISIPDSVTTIEEGAFAGCNGLVQFTGKYASDNGRCLIIEDRIVAVASSGINKYCIPNNVKIIGEESFYANANLCSIIIPENVDVIEDSAFGRCANLENIYLKSTTPPVLGSFAFMDCATSYKIYVPQNYGNTYKSTEDWVEYSHRIAEYDYNDGIAILNIK